MVKAPMEVYQHTLAGYIHDDDKLVTYKWLSKELEVHVNTAKEILADYWKEHKTDGITATVLLIGDLKNGGQRVEVVNESRLEEAAEKYDRIKSQHIYSLQKTLPDIQSLARTGKGNIAFAAIKCQENVILSDDELFSRRWGFSNENQVSSDKDNKPAPPSVKTKEPSNSLNKLFANAKPPENKDNDKAENKTDKSKESPKTESPTEVKKSSPVKSGDKKGTVSKKPVQSTQKGLNALFGKVQNQKKSPPSTSNGVKTSDNTKPSSAVDSTSKEESPMKHVDEKSETPVTDDKSNQKVKTTLSSATDDVKKSSTVDSKKGPEKHKNSPSSTGEKHNKTGSTKPDKSKNSSRGKKRERSQESQANAKKRKRIVVVSDSSDESEPEVEMDTFEDSMIEEPVTKQRSPSPPPTEKLESKRKIRKTVDKHFVDEDGFMVTKKVQVTESASEDEAIPEPPKVQKSSPPKASAISKVKKNTKQPSIMSFFKKS